MADKVKTRVAIACGRDDRDRVIHQAVSQIVRKLAWIRPRAGRVTALARRNGAITHIAERRDLGAPAMHRFGKAVQQQHQRRAGLARDEGVEGEARGDGDLFLGRHAAILDRQCRPVHDETEFSFRGPPFGPDRNYARAEKCCIWGPVNGGRRQGYNRCII
jgi:hypothetical protein